ncbi:hypothetical protein BDM02DRAFT_3267747 [Thelephora ganbajun]|uniref:Uncharacterized protein n=1 Tax=Thelephora ganbajun TaxID=370292 RepID=A0ACB6ZMD8_THEGA|nr:hypothetical protein BDM02DRAFT_3267747 [Thelephora ganbajun]
MRFTPVLHSLFDKYKLFAARVAFSKLTTCYFVFSVVHCIIQIALQGHAFSTNAKAATFLWDVVVQGNAKVHGVLSFGTDLRVCDSVENALSHGSCQLVWNGNSTKSTQSTPLSSSIISTYSKTSTLVPPSSLPPATTSLIRTVTSTSLPVSRSSSFPSLTPSHTRPSVPAPTPSPGEPVLVGNKNSDEAEEPEIVVLRRRSQEGLGKIHAINENGETVVQIDGLGHTGTNVVLGRKCLISLNWPATTLDNTKREDIVFIAFQIWVLGMSTVAILNESIPHVIASLFTHMVATGWGTFQIIHTNQFRTSFSSLITNGACGVNLLPAYWGPRRSAEISSLTLNVLALLIGIILSWRLTKAFGWRTFKRMGASMQIRSQYRAVLILSVIIQLALFFIVASAGLWLDQLVNGVVSQIATHKVLYEVLAVLVLVLLIPWLALGWISVRKEQRVLMAVFLGMSTLYLASWGAMFASASFRWTFLVWRFFSLVASTSVLLAFSALITGIVCRLGFGMGLPEHLSKTRHTEDEDTLFTPYMRDDISEISTEKVGFPPLGYPVPTFSVAFRSNDEEDPLEKSQAPNPHMGPRFFYGSLAPSNQQAVIKPPPAHTRQQSQTSNCATTHLYRYDSGASNHSRTDSDTSVESNIGRSGSGRKRWVIE